MNDSYSNHARLEKRALSIPTNLSKQGQHARGPAVDVPDAAQPIGALPKTRKLPRYPPERAKARVALQEPEVRLFSISAASEEEQSRYVAFVKDKMKIYRALFDRYAQGPAPGQRSLTFEGLRKAKEVVSLPQIHKFLQEFRIGRQEFLKPTEVKQMVKLINLQSHAERSRIAELDLEGFIEFLLQLGHYTEGAGGAPASEFMSSLFERLAFASLQSDVPLLRHVFRPARPPPRHISKHSTELLHQVTLQSEAEMTSEPEDIARQVLDDLLQQLFGFPLRTSLELEHTSAEGDVKERRSNPRYAGAQRGRLAEIRRLVHPVYSGTKRTRPARLAESEQQRTSANHSTLQHSDADQSLSVGRELTVAAKPGRRVAPTPPAHPYLNQLQRSKVEKQLQEIRDQHAQAQRTARRQQALKRQLEEYHELRRQQELEHEQRLLQEQRRRSEIKARQEGEKQQHYSQIRDAYERDRLPSIQQQKSLQEKLAGARKAEQEARRRDTNRRVRGNTTRLRLQFQQAASKRRGEQEMQEERERQAQAAEDKRKQRLKNQLNTEQLRALRSKRLPVTQSLESGDNPVSRVSTLGRNRTHLQYSQESLPENPLLQNGSTLAPGGDLASQASPQVHSSKFESSPRGAKEPEKLEVEAVKKKAGGFFARFFKGS